MEPTSRRSTSAAPTSGCAGTWRARFGRDAAPPPRHSPTGPRPPPSSLANLGSCSWLPLDRAPHGVGLGTCRLLARDHGVQRLTQPRRVVGRLLVVGIGRALVAQPVLRVE